MSDPTDKAAPAAPETRPRTTLFDALGPSEGADFPDGVHPTVTIGGQEFKVCSFVGDTAGGAAILHRDQVDMPIGQVADRLLFTAINVVIANIDWDRKTDPDAGLTWLLQKAAGGFYRIHAEHMKNLAARGKPS